MSSSTMTGFILIVWKKFLSLKSVFDPPSVIKNVSSTHLKLTSPMVMPPTTNYLSHIHSSVGMSTGHVKILLVSVLITLLLRLISVKENHSPVVSHLLPPGVSGLLMTFIPPIEIPGVSTRPITLAARLATNTSCGHVTSMMFSHFLTSDLFPTANSTGLLLIGLPMIEFLVCLIQAHVLWSLSYTYLTDIEIQVA